MVAQAYVSAKGDPAALIDPLERIHTLLHVHATERGGALVPSGIDVAIATLPTIEAAIDLAFAMRGEIEATREPSAHRHGTLTAYAISHGSLVERPDGRVLGVPIARALRLATVAGPLSDVLLDERAVVDLPPGLGRYEGKRSVRDLLGFGFQHLVDYR